MKSQRPIWMERPRLPMQAAKLVVLTVIVLVFVLPFLSILGTSLASNREVTRSGGMIFFPLHPTLAAYGELFQGGVVTRAVIVSTVVTVVGTLLSLSVSAGLAYALSRPSTFGARPVLLVVLATLFFAPGIIPVYLTVKQLGLINQYASLILPVLVLTFNVVVLRAFFMDLPQDLSDCARMDGAGEFSILLRIVLPLSKPVLAVIGLFYAVGYWNSWFQALLYLNNSTMWPLQLVLRLYVIQGQSLADTNARTTLPPAESIQMAVVIVALLPILAVYPFLQRYFAKGVLTGAIKG